jgi:hypothetical protein
MLLCLWLAFVCEYLSASELLFQPGFQPTKIVEQSNSPDPRIAIPSHDPVTDGWLHGATARAWQALTQTGRYRWAGQDDFRFPDWAKRRFGQDLERAMRMPIQEGHIKRSYRSNEAALVVIDTTRQDWNRYAIVIFSERNKLPSGCELKWLLRDKDLSRVKLDWSSGDTLGVLEYGDDGLYKHCSVKWSRKKRRYACDLRRIQ